MRCLKFWFFLEIRKWDFLEGENGQNWFFTGDFISKRGGNDLEMMEMRLEIFEKNLKIKESLKNFGKCWCQHEREQNQHLWKSKFKEIS